MFVRQALNSQAEYERESAAIKRVKGWVAKPWEWHKKQSAKAVFFPSYGWVPRVAIAGRTRDGLIVPWVQFRNEDHEFLLADWFVAKQQTKGN
jgi:hypothetical protein